MSQETIQTARNAQSTPHDLILTIDPGTTSTKIGIYRRAGLEFTQTIRHGDVEMERFKGQPMLERADYRAAMIRDALAAAGYCESGRGQERWAAVGGRGGLLPPMECGTYLVDETMFEALRQARRGEHACNLGAVLASRFAQAAGVHAYIVDPVTVDEWQPQARFSGTPLIERLSIGHALNSKAMARRYARQQGTTYAKLRLIVVHMGSGITVSAHRYGRTIDNNSLGEGPFGPDRTGGLPARELVLLCFSGKMTKAELDHHIFGDGGLFAYLGTRDLVEVERRIAAGDPQARAVFDAMVYQIAKEIGSMAVVLEGNVDAIILTGGMAHCERLVNGLRRSIEWIAPVTIYPGEDELQALAEGVYRVLDGEEQPKRMTSSF